MLSTKSSNLQAKLDEFVNLAQHETSLPLVIAHSQAQLKVVAEYLQSRGLSKLTSFEQLLEELAQAGSNFIILQEPHKALYDTIVQYPMAQIQLTKPANSAPILITPSYDATRILLITNHHLDSWQAQGYDLLRASGMSLRLGASDE